MAKQNNAPDATPADAPDAPDALVADATVADATVADAPADAPDATVADTPADAPADAPDAPADAPDATPADAPADAKPLHFRVGLASVLMQCGCNSITAKTVASNVYNKTRSITDTETRITRVSALVAKYTLRYDPVAVGQAISKLILDMAIVEKQEKSFTRVDEQAASIRDAVLDLIEG
jgi:hypothetical protein